MKDCLIISLVAMALAAASVPRAYAQPCVAGTITAEYQNSGPFAGLYQYTAVLTWDTPQGLSNITIDCGFDQCPEPVCLQTFMFDTPAGSSSGEGGCTVDYYGEFNCGGNPSIDVTWPIIKWDALGECQPKDMGTATLIFYTNMGPQSGTSMPVVLIKNGLNVCDGFITGDCPAPPCIVPTEDATWGKVKARFR